MSYLHIKFGRRLKQLRTERNLTQEQLAEMIDVSPEFVSNMERGINAPSFETLSRLSDLLQVRTNEFFIFDQ